MPRSSVRLNSEQKIVNSTVLTEPLGVSEYDDRASNATLRRLRILLDQRFFLFRATAYGLALATVLAFLIPVRYEARTQLMPPENESGSGLASYWP
jgi:hypothetical protein